MSRRRPRKHRHSSNPIRQLSLTEEINLLPGQHSLPSPSPSPAGTATRRPDPELSSDSNGGLFRVSGNHHDVNPTARQLRDRIRNTRSRRIHHPLKPSERQPFRFIRRSKRHRYDPESLTREFDNLRSNEFRDSRIERRERVVGSEVGLATGEDGLEGAGEVGRFGVGGGGGRREGGEDSGDGLGFCVGGEGDFGFAGEVLSRRKGG